MHKYFLNYFLFLLSVLIFTCPALAHFGMVIPSDQMVMQEENRNLKIDLMFWHPFEGIGMDLSKPADFGVYINGKKENLIDSLKPSSIEGHQIWIANYKIKTPGVYIFYMKPELFWEQAEDCYIVHYTKSVVAAFGDNEGWDHEVGLKTEIIPLTKPYGLYTGNVFQGIVKTHGKAVPYAEVEIEYYNKEKKYSAPNDYMITQTIKADSQGIFTYAAPKAGWWGFAALTTSDTKIKYNGKYKDVEIGAVIWVKFINMN